MTVRVTFFSYVHLLKERLFYRGGGGGGVRAERTISFS